MKRFIYILSLLIIFSTTVFADSGILDVFEEYAGFDDFVCRTGAVVSYTQKNEQVSGKFIIDCEESFVIEIVNQPKLGTVEINEERGEFVYTPNKDILGRDRFSYRVVSGDISSNISQCTVVISKEKSDSVSGDFHYADMVGNSADFAAVKMVELGVIKGERVGEEYYFYPKNNISRISAVAYINAVLDIDSKSVETEDIFEDCGNLPHQMKKNIKIACDANIISKNNKNFYPHEYVTRAEFFTMIEKAMGAKTNSDTELLYIDKADIPDYAKISIKNLVCHDMIDNSKDTALRPNDCITREEAVGVLYNLVKFHEKNTQQTLSQRIKEEVYGKIKS